MRRPRLALSVALAALAACAGGCGNQRQDAPRIPPSASPVGTRTENLVPYGVTFERPRNWTLTPGRPPQPTVVSSGRAFVAVWRYKRAERLPAGAADLVRARQALVTAARTRDRTLRVLSARALRVAGVPAVQLLATERIGSARRQVRSTHLYANGAELVVDAYAPPEEFAEMDRRAFGPLLRSLRVPRAPAQP